MTIPSRVMGAGATQLMTVSICGNGGDTLTSTGSTRTDALQLTKVYNNVSSAAAGTGVLLPPTQEGEVIYVTNTDLNPIKVYPYESTSTISGGSSVTLSKSYSAVFFAVTKTTWQMLQGFNNSGNVFYYGSFYDTTTQTIAVAGTAYPITLNATAESNGVSRSSPTSRILFANAGVYNIQYSVQIEHGSGGGSGDTASVWLRLNGSDVANSASTMLITNATKYGILSINYVLTIAAGSYLELVWTSDTTGMKLSTIAASGSVPQSPSIILTATPVH